MVQASYMQVIRLQIKSILQCVALSFALVDSICLIVLVKKVRQVVVQGKLWNILSCFKRCS